MHHWRWVQLMGESVQTLTEVDRVLARLRQTEMRAVTLSHEEVRWLLAEIEGGREAFDTVVRQKKGLEQQVARMQRTIDDLLAMRGRA